MFITKPSQHVLSPVPNSSDWVVRSEIRYFSKILGGMIVVKENFITDLASVPRFFWTIFPPSGKYDLAVILHDWLFWNQLCTFKQANEVLRESMLICGCKKRDADLFYFAVSTGSKSVWNKYSLMSSEDRESGFAIISGGDIIIPKSRI